MKPIITFLLFTLTAIAEIVGCYLGYQVLVQKKSPWLVIPLILSLSIFVYLLTLHPTVTGRVYAAYGGIYIATALAWLRWIENIALTPWDIAGGIIVLAGALIIILQPHTFVR